MRNTALFLLLTAILAAVSACRGADPERPEGKSIVILYENDVHCAIGGYAKLAGLRDAILSADTSYVAVVSSGDFIHGGWVGNMSEGEDIIPVINAVGYDALSLATTNSDSESKRCAPFLPNWMHP